jgi:2-oxoisovalerate dehydrogenase E2 component (dihydrolipoyl transacylase)
MKSILSQSLRSYRTFQISRKLPLIHSSTFHISAPNFAVKPILLADVGEGITECEIVQWFVQPGARVAQFDKICEVQSDKAAAEVQFHN